MADSLVVKAIIKAKDLLSTPVVRAAGTIRSKLGPALSHARAIADRVGTRIKCLGDTFARVGRFGMTLAKIGGILGGFAGFSFRNIIKSGDDLSEFAQRVGIGVEALQELRFAAERSDLDVKDFDQGLTTLNKNMGQLRAGTGKLSSFLGKVSPNLRRQMLAAKDTGAAFDIMVAAISKIPDPARRAALAQAAFNNSKMANMAKNGAAGLAALREEARKYGLITEEEAAAAAEADDAMINLKRSMVGVGNAIGSKVIPILIPLIQRLTDWIIANRQLIATRVQQFIEGVVTAVKNIDWDAVRTGLAQIVVVVKQVAGWMGGWGNTTILLASIFSGVLKPALGLGVEVLKLLWFVGKPLLGLLGKMLPLAVRLLGGVFTKVLIPAILLVAKAVGTAGAFLAANPIILIIAAIIAVVAGLVYVIYKYWDPIKAWFVNLWAGVSETFWKAVDGIKAAMQPVLDYLGLWWQTVSGIFGGLVDFVAGVFTGDLDRAFGGVKRVFDSLWTYIETVWGYIKAPIEAVGRWLGITGGKISAASPIGPTAQTSASAPSPYAPPVPSAMPRAAAPGGAQSSFAGEMRIKVESDGPRVSVDKVKGDNRNISIFTNVGRRSFAYGGT
jgi:X-X-X-Leu-X-X-Gly heptad repeat protein